MSELPSPSPAFAPSAVVVVVVVLLPSGLGVVGVVGVVGVTVVLSFGPVVTGSAKTGAQIVTALSNAVKAINIDLFRRFAIILKLYHVRV